MKNYLNSFKLTNKLAFVVGGNGFIGREVVNVLIGAGAKVIIIDNVKKKEIKNATYEKIDITKLNRLTQNINRLIKKYKVPDCFINCSYPKTKDWSSNSYKKIKIQSFQKNISSHMNSFVWFAKIIADKMKSKKKGSIVQLSSIYGILGQDVSLYKDTDMSESMSYAAIKGGITNSVRSMAAYYGKYNIRVNALCPGGVKDKQDVKFIKRYIKKTPLNRMADPEDIANACLFLLSDASSYITGTTLLIDGGWSCI